MKCDGCGNEHAYRTRTSEYGECCDRCGGLSSVWVPDVAFDKPYLDPNLGHPNRPHEVNGVWVESKRHKAALMAEQNLVERGDRRHGSRNLDKSLARREAERFGNRF